MLFCYLFRYLSSISYHHLYLNYFFRHSVACSCCQIRAKNVRFERSTYSPSSFRNKCFLFFRLFRDPNLNHTYFLAILPLNFLLLFRLHVPGNSGFIASTCLGGTVSLTFNIQCRVRFRVGTLFLPISAQVRCSKESCSGIYSEGFLLCNLGLPIAAGAISASFETSIFCLFLVQRASYGNWKKIFMIE